VILWINLYGFVEEGDGFFVAAEFGKRDPLQAQ
jgi:hypothetical protein